MRQQEKKIKIDVRETKDCYYYKGCTDYKQNSRLLLENIFAVPATCCVCETWEGEFPGRSKRVQLDFTSPRQYKVLQRKFVFAEELRSR